MNEPHVNRKKKPVLLKKGNRQGDPMNAPRCGAKTRSGAPCRSPAMANGRCRKNSLFTYEISGGLSETQALSL